MSKRASERAVCACCGRTWRVRDLDPVLRNKDNESLLVRGREDHGHNLIKWKVTAAALLKVFAAFAFTRVFNLEGDFASRVNNRLEGLEGHGAKLVPCPQVHDE